MKCKWMRYALIAPAMAVLFWNAQGQGIGDRNRAADGGDGNWSIQGRVYLPNGKPAAEAKVGVSSADTIPVQLTTNLDGVFQVGSLRAGNYSISVRVPGLPAETELLTIDRDSSPGRTFNVVVYLRGEGRQAAAAAAESTNPLLAGVPADALDKFRKGEEKLRRSDFKGAAALFDEATRSHPAFAAAYYEKGQAQLKDNDLDGALGSFVKAVQAKQDYLEAKYSVGYTQFLRKNYEVAAAVFDDVLKQKRDMPEAHMYLGISLYHLKNVEAAEAALRSAIAAHDGENVALAHRFLGGIYLQKKRNSEAAAELERYLELVPKAPDAGRLKETIAGLKKSS